MSFIFYEKVKFTFTIVPTPSDAIVKINNVVQKSVTVTKGSEVTYSIEKDGYISQSGNQVVTDNTTLEVELVAKPLTESNPVILESGRKLWRHPNNEGCVLEFNEFGKTTKLFVPDAVYRSTEIYSLIPSSNQNDFRYLDSIGAPHIQYNKISLYLTNLESNTDSALQTFLTQSIPNISTEWTAKQYTNAYLQYVPDSPACLFARSIVPTGLSGCDVPNLYELCVLWLEGANIDKYDPTVTENSSKKMEKFDFSTYVWASTETADGSAGSSSTWFHAPNFTGSNGDVTTDYARNASRGVVPVLEL